MDSSFQALFFAIVLSLTIPLLHLSLIALIRRKQILLMFVSFLIYVSIAILSPVYLKIGTLPAFATALFTSLSACLLYMEFFSMICRGFSLNIILTIANTPRATTDLIIERYSDKGLSWLMSKRLESMKKLGLISYDEFNIVAGGKMAICIGCVGLFFKKILNLPEGG